MDPDRLDAALARTQAAVRRLRGLERRLAVSRLDARHDADWSESKHQRANDGRFGSQAGNHAGKEEGGKPEGKATEAKPAQPALSEEQKSEKVAKVLDRPKKGKDDDFDAAAYAPIAGASGTTTSRRARRRSWSPRADMTMTKTNDDQGGETAEEMFAARPELFDFGDIEPDKARDSEGMDKRVKLGAARLDAMKRDGYKRKPAQRP